MRWHSSETSIQCNSILKVMGMMLLLRSFCECTVLQGGQRSKNHALSNCKWWSLLSPNVCAFLLIPISDDARRTHQSPWRRPNHIWHELILLYSFTLSVSQFHIWTFPSLRVYLTILANHSFLIWQPFLPTPFQTIFLAQTIRFCLQSIIFHPTKRKKRTGF